MYDTLGAAPDLTGIGHAAALRIIRHLGPARVANLSRAQFEQMLKGEVNHAIGTGDYSTATADDVAAVLGMPADGTLGFSLGKVFHNVTHAVTNVVKGAAKVTKDVVLARPQSALRDAANLAKTTLPKFVYRPVVKALPAIAAVGKFIPGYGTVVSLVATAAMIGVGLNAKGQPNPQLAQQAAADNATNWQNAANQVHVAVQPLLNSPQGKAAYALIRNKYPTLPGMGWPPAGKPYAPHEAIIECGIAAAIEALQQGKSGQAAAAQAQAVALDALSAMGLSPTHHPYGAPDPVFTPLLNDSIAAVISPAPAVAAPVASPAAPAVKTVVQSVQAAIPANWSDPNNVQALNIGVSAALHAQAQGASPQQVATVVQQAVQQAGLPPQYASVAADAANLTDQHPATPAAVVAVTQAPAAAPAAPAVQSVVQSVQAAIPANWSDPNNVQALNVGVSAAMQAQAQNATPTQASQILQQMMQAAGLSPQYASVAENAADLTDQHPATPAAVASATKPALPSWLLPALGALLVLKVVL